jgi:hypothetical protein
MYLPSFLQLILPSENTLDILSAFYKCYFEQILTSAIQIQKQTSKSSSDTEKSPMIPTNSNSTKRSKQYLDSNLHTGQK